VYLNKGRHIYRSRKQHDVCEPGHGETIALERFLPQCHQSERLLRICFAGKAMKKVWKFGHDSPCLCRWNDAGRDSGGRRKPPKERPRQGISHLLCVVLFYMYGCFAATIPLHTGRPGTFSMGGRGLQGEGEGQLALEWYKRGTHAHPKALGGLPLILMRFNGLVTIRNQRRHCKKIGPNDDLGTT
jgi:hypothetical protein